jgi:hypothetical protein
MSDPPHFYREWSGRSFRAALVITGIDRGRDIMRNVLLWAFACLVLFFIPWKDVPVIGVKTEDLSHEVRLGLSAVSAIIVVFALSFLYQLIKQPSVMYEELRRRTVKAENILSEIENVERDKQILSDLHREGVTLYHSFVNQEDPGAPNKWISDMDMWLEKVRNHIRDRWSISTLHEFNDPSRLGGFSYKRRDAGLNDIKNTHGGDVMALYSGYIKSVDDIIRFNSGDHFGQRRLESGVNYSNDGVYNTASTSVLPDAEA